MKKLLLAGLVASATALTALPTYAQTDNAAVVQEVGINSIIDILNNVTADTSPEQLREDLVEAIKRICKNKEEVNLKNIQRHHYYLLISQSLCRQQAPQQ